MSAADSQTPTTRFPQFGEEWEIGRLGDVAITVTSGSRDWAQYYADEGSKFIRMTNLPRGGIQLLLDDLRFVKLNEDSSEGKRTSLTEYDLLISITAELGKIGIIPPNFGTAYINQHTALVRLDLEQADARFVAHKLSSKKMNNKINRLNDSGAKSGLNLPTIRSFPISLPTLPEQQKIADFLTAVDGRIGQLIQKKSLLEDYKKGVIQQLFTQAIRFKDKVNREAREGPLGDKVNREAREGPLGCDHGNDFPDWEEKKFGEVASILNGYAFKSVDFDETKRNKVIRMSDLKSGRLAEADHALVSDQIVDGLERFSLKAGDFLFGMSGSLSNFAWVAEEDLPAFLNQRVGCLREKEKNIASFVQYLYLSREVQKRIEQSAVGAAQLNISSNFLNEMELPIPHPDEQIKIADFLSTIDRKIESVATQITETQTFKRGLLQQMFV